MEWSDEGIVLGVRGHGETGAIADIFTRAHGRHLGFVHGGRSRKIRPILQAGNHVSVTWRARLEDHMGHFAVELLTPRAAEAMNDPLALAGLMSLCELGRLLPERDPHANLYEVAQFVLSFLDDVDVWPQLYVRWELALLDELGMGLDLGRCAATGATDGLIYVSPKSGRAVSRDAGAPYADRMFALPPFLRRGDNRRSDLSDVGTGLDMTGHFLAQRVFAPDGKDLPEPRQRLRQRIARAS
ncbi:MAG: DNA repair protein RecO [Pseudomonadota bacterium]